jgi:phosphoribosylformimino-5-aminoimidazole carboxamide ribotide isomerase
MQIIPAIDLKDGRCVRLSQGEFDTAKVYGADPFEQARRFADAGAELIHIVDLDGAKEGGRSANRSVAKEVVSRLGVDVEFGGGVRSESDVEELVDCGVSRVILGTLATESPEILKSLVERFGPKVCVGIDARDGVVMTRGWAAKSDLTAGEFAVEVAKLGVERIIYTDIKRDGMLTGPNIEETISIARKARVKVTASGGVSSIDDLRRLVEAGEPLIDSVIVGKALYENRFSLEEALQLTT